MKTVAVTFADQIRAAETEVNIARGFFRRQVERRRMKPEEAEKRLAGKMAIVETLRELESRGDYPQQIKRLRSIDVDL